MTIREPSPKRVANIIIWLGELFCISSAIINARLNVRPLIKARGAISNAPDCNMASISRFPYFSPKISKIGRVQGSILLTNPPGKNPISSSSTEIMGRVKIIFCTSPRESISTAVLQANNVLPVPAGPTANKIDTWGSPNNFE